MSLLLHKQLLHLWLAGEIRLHHDNAVSIFYKLLLFIMTDRTDFVATTHNHYTITKFPTMWNTGVIVLFIETYA